LPIWKFLLIIHHFIHYLSFVNRKSNHIMKNFIENLIHRLTYCALGAGMGWVLAMMILTTGDVTSRYFFSVPIPGSVELGEFMLAIFGIMGMAYTHHTGGNISVTLLTNALPPRGQALLAVFSNLLSLIIIGLIVWQGWINGTEEFYMGTRSDMLGLPVYPFKFLLSLGAFFLSLEIMLSLVKSLGKLTEHKSLPGGKN
jgi:TRAP-type C4-dicarboxylate transport system permease small subunit